MTRQDIMQVLPHRDPMLLIERAHLDESGAAHGFYKVRGDEFFLQGHYPDNPIVPGVILCEMAAQTCCVLFAEQLKGKTPMFTGINKVKFRNPVRPGDTIETVCTLIRSIGNISFVKGKAMANGKFCMSGEFSFAVV